MNELFYPLINMSISATWVALIVMILRFFVKKVSKRMTCLLWLLVGIRLCCPIFIESNFSIIPNSTPVRESTVSSTVIQETVDKSKNTSTDTIVKPAINNNPINEKVEAVDKRELEHKKFDIHNAMVYAPFVWLSGVSIMLGYIMVSFMRLRKNLKVSIKTSENVYICDEIDAPFVAGLLSPKVYVPSALSEVDYKNVLMHETAHVERKDHIWKLIAFVVLSFYWFNPVLWVAYVLFGRDLELACDEKVIQNLGAMEKKNYAQSLLDCSSRESLFHVCPIAFGDVGVKERVKAITGYKKPGIWVIIFAIIICGGVAVCCLTNPAKKIAAKEINERLAVSEQGIFYLKNNMLYEYKDNKWTADPEYNDIKEIRTGEGLTIVYNDGRIDYLGELENDENMPLGSAYCNLVANESIAFSSSTPVDSVNQDVMSVDALILGREGNIFYYDGYKFDKITALSEKIIQVEGSYMLSESGKVYRFDQENNTISLLYEENKIINISAAQYYAGCACITENRNVIVLDQDYECDEHMADKVIQGNGFTLTIDTFGNVKVFGDIDDSAKSEIENNKDISQVCIYFDKIYLLAKDNRLYTIQL